MGLSFGAESPDRIEEGMRRLAAAVRAVVSGGWTMNSQQPRVVAARMRA